MRYQTIQEFTSNTALTPIKDLSRNPKLLVPSPILLLMLAACGGGGGGGGARPVVTAPTSLDPDLLSGLLSATTDENNADFSHALLPTAELAELEGEVTLSLAASGEGNDNEFFVIDGNGYLVLSDDADASQVFDHETTPTRTVSVTATATDDSGENLTRDVVISINDIADEDPVFTSSPNVSVLAGSGGNIHHVNATPDIDGTSITYSIENEDIDDNALFEIDSDSGLLSLKSDAVLVPEIHTVRVTATDTSNTALTASQDITIIVTGTPNEAPTALSLSASSSSVPEGTTTETMLATITITDADGGNNVVVVSDTDLFEIRNGNELWLRAGVNLDYETVADRSNQVTVSIQGHPSVSAVFTLNVDNVFDQLDLTASASTQSIEENITAATDTGISFSVDTDDSFDVGDFTITGTGANLFEVYQDGQTYKLRALGADPSPFDAEVTDEYDLTVTLTTDNNLTDDVSVKINVTDVDEDPVFASNAPTSFNLAENETSATFGTVTATDPEGGTVTYDLDDAAKSRGFAIDASGEISFDVANGTNLTAFDYDALTTEQRTIPLTVTARDGANNSATHDVTITITDENEDPVFASNAPTSFNLAENVTSATLGTVTATDPEGGTVTYSLNNDAPTGFAINQTTGAITFSNSTAYDYETLTSEQRTVPLTVTASDGVESATHGVTVTIIDIDETLPDFSAAPDSLNLAENATSATLGTVTAIFGNTLTYSLENAPAGFAINASGEISFDIANGTNLTAYDYETLTSEQRTVPLTVKAEDSANNSATHNVDINITDENEAPVFADNAPTSFNLEENIILAIFDPVTATDPEGGTVTYSLNNDAPTGFAINQTTGAITFSNSTAYDYEALTATQRTIPLTVTARDGEESATHDVAINITDVDVRPVFNGSATATTNENNAGFSHALPFITDSPTGTVTLTLAAGVDDNDLFEINSNDDLVVKLLSGENAADAAARVLDHENGDTRTVTVTATDDANTLSIDQTITITITDINEGPLFELPAQSVTIDETHEAFDQTNNTAPAILTGFTGTADIGNGNVSFRVTGAYADHFTMSNRQLFLTSQGQTLIDQEANNAQSSFDVEITARVGTNTTNVTTRTLTVNVTDVNDEAPAFTLSDFNIRNDLTTSNALLAAPLSATPDVAGTSLSFAITGTDAANFRVGNDNNLYLTNAGVAVLATTTSFDITVTATAGTSPGRSQNLTITVLNEDPTALSLSHDNLSIDEGTTTETMLATITITDADGGNNEVEVSDDTLFEIRDNTSTGDKELWLRGNVDLDYETLANPSIQVTVSIQGHANLSDDFTLNVDNVFDQIDLTASASTESIEENITSATDTGISFSITTDDSFDANDFTITGTGANLFDVVDDGGTYRLQALGPFDVDVTDEYDLTVTLTTNNGLTDNVSVKITITEVDDEDPVFPATPSAFNLAENETRADIGTVTATDDNALTYSLDTASTDRGFAINASGEITFDVTSDPNLTAYDHEALTDAQRTVTLMVTAEDPRGNNATHQVNVTITDVADENPVFNGDDNPTAARHDANFSHALPFTTDLGGSVTLTLASGGDNDLFEIDNGNLVLKSSEDPATVFDYDTKASLTATVTATDDANNALTTPVTIVIDNTPDFIEFDVFSGRIIGAGYTQAVERDPDDSEAPEDPEVFPFDYGMNLNISSGYINDADKKADFEIDLSGSKEYASEIALEGRLRPLLSDLESATAGEPIFISPWTELIRQIIEDNDTITTEDEAFARLIDNFNDGIFRQPPHLRFNLVYGDITADPSTDPFITLDDLKDPDNYGFHTLGSLGAGEEGDYWRLGKEGVISTGAMLIMEVMGSDGRADFSKLGATNQNLANNFMFIHKSSVETERVPDGNSDDYLAWINLYLRQFVYSQPYGAPGEGQNSISRLATYVTGALESKINGYLHGNNNALTDDFTLTQDGTTASVTDKIVSDTGLAITLTADQGLDLTYDRFLFNVTYDENGVSKELNYRQDSNDDPSDANFTSPFFIVATVNQDNTTSLAIMANVEYGFDLDKVSEFEITVTVDKAIGPDQTAQPITVTITDEYVYDSGTTGDDSFDASAVTAVRWDGLGGEDTVTFANATQGVVADLSKDEDAVPDNTVFGTAHYFRNVENLIGSNFDDILIGDSGANSLDGGDGIDTVSYASSNEGVNVNLGSTQTQTYFSKTYISGHSGGHAAGDALLNFENILGSAHDDTLNGDDGVNILEGAGGSDTLTGNGGNDIFVAYIENGASDTIKDFTDGDKVRIDVDDPSAISDLTSLYAALSITATNNTDHTGNSSDDTVLRFDRGTAGDASDDYLIVFEGFTDGLDINDFDII